MVQKKKRAGEGLAKRMRDAGVLAKQNVENRLKIQADAAAQQEALAAGIDLTTKLEEIIPFKPKIFNILEYIEQSWGLAMRLFPAQRFIVKMYYHLPLDTHDKPIEVKNMTGEKVLYRFSEKEYLNYLYNEGRCNIGVQDHERRELVLAIGRRAGKSTLSGIFASYEIYRLLNLHNPQSYYGLPNGNRIQIISIAADKDQAGILFNEVTGHLAKCDYFKPYIANNTLSHITFRTPYDIERYGDLDRRAGKFQSFNGKATLRVTFKGSVSKSLRGPGNVVVILDEMAHYQDQGSSSAKDIYDAVTPSTAAFSPKNPDTGLPLTKSDGTEWPVESRIISISSPLNKSGKFYELFHLAMTQGPGSENILAMQAPTWEVNPTLPSSYYRQKYHADPSVFMTEHGAQFSDRVKGWVERKEDLEACLDLEAMPQLNGPPRYPHQIGIDIGLVNDGTAVAITSEVDGKIVLVYHEYWQAGIDWRVSNPHLGLNYSTDYCKRIVDEIRLDFEAIGEWIVSLTKRFFITDGLFDRWNGIPLEQALQKKGITQIKSEHFHRDMSSKIYQNTKLMMLNGTLRLYDYPRRMHSSTEIAEHTVLGSSKHSPLVSELLTLQQQQMSKNVVVVSKPATGGYNDDMSDAYVRAVWLTTERMQNRTHIYGNNSNAPVTLGSGMTSGRYQMMRSRHHGVNLDRPTNRNLRGGLNTSKLRNR